tara:strand:- start:495 stop:671 length:177 start_codon:yes stop_codon:yes gene_type:complete
LVWIIEGCHHKIGVVVSIDGSPWHKHIQDWSYYILTEEGFIVKKRGWRVETIQGCENK